MIASAISISVAWMRSWIFRSWTIARSPGKATIATVAVLCSFGSAIAQDFDRTKINELLDTLASENKAMGSVVIAKDGQIVYCKAFGYRLIYENGKIPADPDTRYRIASTTKTFTATMIFQLIEEGKLTLQTTLDAYLPEVRNAKHITIQDLLGHRSGLHNYTQNDDAPSWLGTYQTHEQMLAHISKHAVDFQPNERSAYSNSNYLLLGYILEKIDGRSYRESLQKRITSRIGFPNTFFRVIKTSTEENK